MVAKRAKKASVAKAGAAVSKAATFPIVGLGASAGGLDAFFRALAEGQGEREVGIVLSATGNDFSHDKKPTIGRRIERRMNLHDIDDAAVCARYLEEQPAEAQLLLRELPINVTSFFRDGEAFAALRHKVLPQFDDLPRQALERFDAQSAGRQQGAEPMNGNDGGSAHGR